MIDKVKVGGRVRNLGGKRMCQSTGVRERVGSTQDLQGGPGEKIKCVNRARLWMGEGIVWLHENSLVLYQLDRASQLQQGSV